MQAKDRFIEHNKTSAIIDGAWLDKNKRAVTGDVNTWKYCRYKLEDGTIYTLAADDVDWINRNASFKWFGVSPDVQGEK